MILNNYFFQNLILTLAVTLAEQHNFGGHKFTYSGYKRFAETNTDAQRHTRMRAMCFISVSTYKIHKQNLGQSDHIRCSCPKMTSWNYLLMRHDVTRALYNKRSQNDNLEDKETRTHSMVRTIATHNKRKKRSNRGMPN